MRQLDRQISSLFYERTLLSKNKSVMLRKGAEPQPSDLVTAEEEIKDPLVLEFLEKLLAAELEKTQRALELKTTTSEIPQQARTIGRIRKKTSKRSG